MDFCLFDLIVLNANCQHNKNKNIFQLLSSENITAPFIKKYSPDEENIILERLNTCENNDITT